MFIVNVRSFQKRKAQLKNAFVIGKREIAFCTIIEYFNI